MIIGIMAAVATPKFTGFLRSQELEMSAQRVVADITLLRSWAVSNSKPASFAFAVNVNNYKTDVNGPGHLDDPEQVLFTDLGQAPYHCGIQSADFGGTAELTFNGAGIPVASGTVVVTNGTDQLTITVNPVTGKASVQ